MGIPMRYAHDSMLCKLQERVAQRQSSLVWVPDTGLSAKREEACSIDLIATYNSRRYRMADRGCLPHLMPYGNANEIVHEVLTTN